MIWFGSLITGQQDASGQLYRRNRFYDPKTGQFTQEDPIGLAGGLNEYGFAGGDPVSYGDPYGLCPRWIAVISEAQCVTWDDYATRLSKFADEYIEYEIQGFISGSDPYHRNSERSGRFGQILGLATFMVPTRGMSIGTETMAAERGGVFAYGGEAVERVPIPGNPWSGPNAARQAFAHLERYHGLDPVVASNRLHRIKAAAGLGAADNAVIGRTGDVYHPYTGERLGSLLMQIGEA